MKNDECITKTAPLFRKPKYIRKFWYHICIFVECIIDFVELLRLFGQLGADIAPDKDRLEVHPAALAREPLVERVLEEDEVPAPLLHEAPDAAHVAGAQHGVARDPRLAEGREDVL